MTTVYQILEDKNTPSRHNHLKLLYFYENKIYNE